MRSGWSVAAAVVIACSGQVSARAADLPSAAPPLPPAPVLAPEPSSPFYVRIDGGLGLSGSPQLSISPNPVGRATLSLADPAYRGTYTKSDFSRSRLGNGAFGDLGVGYRVSSALRIDITGEYRGGMDLDALATLVDRGSTNTPFGALPVRNTTQLGIKGRLSSAIVLANGYVDLGNYFGFTPFIGGGIGAARTYASGMKETGRFSVQIANGAPISAPFRGVLGNAGETGLAWALMGGVAYDLTPNLKLEIGYRYLDYGSFRTRTETITLPNGTTAPQPYAGRGRALTANDVKVGLRWSFAAPTLAAAEPPLVRRY